MAQITPLSFNWNTAAGIGPGTLNLFTGITVSGNAPIMLVSIQSVEETISLDGIAVSGVKWGLSQSFTEVPSGSISTSAGKETKWWYLVPSGSGTDFIEATLTGDAAATMSLIFGYYVFVNAQATAPAASTASGTTSPVTLTRDGLNINSYILDAVVVHNISPEATLTEGAGQNVVWNPAAIGTGTKKISGHGSYKLSASGNVTMSWTESANKNWATAVIVVRGSDYDSLGGVVPSLQFGK